jgi:hypothetical protein
VVANSSFLSSGRDPSGHVEMFAPNPVQPGSSVSHFSTSLTPDQLMEPTYTGPIHTPDLARNLMTDIGWDIVTSTSSTSTTTTLPSCTTDAACTDGDACTVDRCGPDGACLHDPFDAATIRSDLVAPASLAVCGSPGGIGSVARLESNVRTVLAKLDGTTSGRKRHRLLARAASLLAKAIKKTGHGAETGRISADCAPQLTDVLTTARKAVECLLRP